MHLDIIRPVFKYDEVRSFRDLAAWPEILFPPHAPEALSLPCLSLLDLAWSKDLSGRTAGQKVHKGV